jgi:hypothetical protein
MEYKFNGKVTFEDFIQMNRLYMKEIFLKGKLLIIFIVFITIILGFFVYDIIAYNKISFIENLLPIIIFCFAMLFIIKTPKILYKKNYEKDKLSHEEQTFIINESEISLFSENSFVKITKDKINKIKFDKDSMYIYLSENKILIIKSRYLNNISEYNELKEFIILNYF